MFFLEERDKWVGEEMACVMAERPHLTHRERRILRWYYEKEFEEVWANRDYVYGHDEGEPPKGATW